MNRRQALRHLAAGGAIGLASQSLAGAQTPPARPDSSAGDPLYRPDLVQQRAVATENDNDPVVKELEHRLKCTCGCNLDIYVCRTTDFTCQYSPALHREVLDLRAAGKTPEEVLAAFVGKYGEQILMAPPPRGFNLAGYLVPGVAVLLAGLTIGAVLRRRAREVRQAESRSATPPAAPMASGSAAEESLRRALAEVQD